ncbi:hypothetical protein QWY82_17970 [Simiduia curdlanivorans]|uniref:DUF6942 family protein n=1 Tax=Simiduia curdlanivorans TaxID=1492769 RepID=A0ABV8V5B4_9GAMM|nr:hypothetical protein [Simiduia curdlanivorans]MDN3640690.1 hypothetical protein [Simiduia curdlanivorans]
MPLAPMPLEPMMFAPAQIENVSSLGSVSPKLAIYIANRPPIAPYLNRQGCFPVVAGELAHIGFNTSNHWRKVFNVFAKFWFALCQSDSRFCARGASSWQAFRDDYLLQAGCDQALVFSRPHFSDPCIHIIAGKTWAQTLSVDNLTWLDAHFAVDPIRRIIVCPYLDYRQLSNARIDQLVALVQSFGARHVS